MNLVATAFPVALGFRAERGGAVTVALAIQAGEPRLLLSAFLATASEGDRLALEPYHVAAAMPRGADGRATPAIRQAVAEGRRRQDAMAAAGLNHLLRRVRDDGGEPLLAALLVNRAGWVRDLVDYSLAFADHPPVAEGLAVREALRTALAGAGVEAEEVDEKSLAGRAEDALGMDAAAIDARLKALGAAAGPPWRKQQKAACLAAWVSLAAPVRAG